MSDIEIKHPLMDEVKELLDSGEIPQKVSNRLIWGALIQSAEDAKQSRQIIQDELAQVRVDVNSNPLGWIPVSWRRRVAYLSGAWMGWVSLNVAGVPLGIDAIWNAIVKYLGI